MNGNFKVRALETHNDFFTKGDIFAFENGITTWNSGSESLEYDNFLELIGRNSWVDYFEEIKEEGENKMEDLRELLEQGFVVKHIDDTLSKVEMNIHRDIIISGKNHWCTISSLTKDLCGYNGDPNAKIMEIYGHSSNNGTACEMITNNRELLWKRTEISPTQLKLEELEKKQREIADEMEKLRKEL